MNEADSWSFQGELNNSYQGLRVAKGSMGTTAPLKRVRTALFVIRHGNCLTNWKYDENNSRRGIKRLRIIFWSLTLAFEYRPSVALPAIERFSGVSPQIIRCGLTLFGEAKVNAWLTLWVVSLEGRGFHYTRRLHPAKLLER
jgi:hypothetical protein